MSYRIGLGGIGGPRIVCDGCGFTLTIYASKQSCAPDKWFLDRKPAPGWELVRVADTRGWDYCPDCKARRKAAQEVEP